MTQTRLSRRLFVLLTLFAVLCPIEYLHASDSDYDYVKEVLDDDHRHYDEDDHHYEDDDNDNAKDNFHEQQRSKEEEMKRQRQDEEESLAREQADRIALEREKAFQADLARMDAEQQKAALRQKKKDERVVKSILKAAKKDKHYAVLGMRNWNLRIPPRDISLGSFKFTIPGLTLKETSTKDVRKAFRSRAIAVHPDKNRDGRAQEAFIAVENAASILSDEKTKAEYDKESRLANMQRRNHSKALVFNAISRVKRSVVKILKALHAVLGPFATPVIILAALLF